MLVIGVLIVLAGMALVSIGSFGQSSTSGGGFVFIGPFPIVFGSGPSGWWLALLSVVIGVDDCAGPHLGIARPCIKGGLKTIHSEHYFIWVIVRHMSPSA